MYRLLIVDDEEIITDSLYEVFHQLMPEKLDVCRAYSGKEALGWMSRTRIDIVMTDIRMPGMNGLELTESILSLWPRCRIIFLTGYSEFDYAYKAIQMPNVRYLLKTEGYDKVTETVREVIREIESSNHMNVLLEQSREQIEALEYMEQTEFFRQLVEDSRSFGSNKEQLGEDFGQLNIRMGPSLPVVLALGRISHTAGKVYTLKKDALQSVRFIWNSFIGDQIQSIGIVDKHGDMLWFLQSKSSAEDIFENRLLLYLEGTLELIQEACLKSLGLAVSFTISGFFCEWDAVTGQYERLRQLQQLRLGDGISMIVKDRLEPIESSISRDGAAPSDKADRIKVHLEAGREDEFLKELDELSKSVLKGDDNIQNAAQAYYSVALVLLANMERLGLQTQIGEREKLLRLDGHVSIKDAFLYLKQTAEDIFQFKRMDDRDKTTHVIDRICQYIEEHLGEDVSLVHLAEVHFFNPSYLSRLFKQERGINLSEYIEKCRIRRAKELLRDGDLKVREVALLVGYDAAHSFTRFFKKTTGLTPQEYRDSYVK